MEKDNSVLPTEIDVSRLDTDATDRLFGTFDKIKSIDNTINQLVNDVSNSDNLDMIGLYKTKLLFQLSRIRLGLKLVNRLAKTMSLIDVVEDNLFDPTRVAEMSIRELIVLQRISGERLDSYYEKVTKIMESINVSELENTLLIITEADSKAKVLSDQSDSNNSIKSLSLKLLQQISDLQKGTIADAEVVPSHESQS